MEIQIDLVAYKLSKHKNKDIEPKTETSTYL